MVSAPIAVVTTAAPAQAVGPAVLPVTVTNNTGRAEAVHLYVLGTNLNTGRLGHVNQAGVFTPWPAGSIPPSPAPDVAISGPGTGGSATIRFPRGFSGRVYFSLGEKLKLFLTPDASSSRPLDQRRPQPQHPVRLERVHLQRRRPLAEQHPGRHAVRAARGHGHRRQRRHHPHRRPGGGWAQQGVQRAAGPAGLGQHRLHQAGRHRPACPGPRQGPRRRGCSVLPTSTLHHLSLERLHQQDTHCGPVRRAARRSLLRAHVRQRHAFHQYSRPDRRLLQQAVLGLGLEL